MRSPTDVKHLKPFLSPLFLNCTMASNASFHKQISDEICSLLSSGAGIKAIRKRRTQKSGNFRYTTIEYIQERPPAWAPSGTMVDVRNHIVVIATKRDHCAVCASDTAIRKQLSRKTKVSRLVPRSQIEAAFVGERASVLWMNGVHATTDAKPYAKTLMGSALEYAIDPLGDQSFFYSSVRSTVEVDIANRKRVSMGASPSGSRVWVSRSTDFSTFIRDLEKLIDRVSSQIPTATRFPSLAVHLEDLSSISGAYEVGFVPSEFNNDDLSEDELRRLEEWCYATRFEIAETKNSQLTAVVYYKEEKLGETTITPSMDQGRVSLGVGWSVIEPGKEDLASNCTNFLKDPDWAKIYYESGHTIARGGCYASSYSDQAFPWSFEDLGGFDVDREKPDVLSGKNLAQSIGEKKGDGSPDNSLFGFVFSKLQTEGWLASDDGSMEIADFIHISDDDVVTLIHAKAASNSDANRSVSASMYEVVVGQAIKNLRHLQQTTLAEALARNKDNTIGEAVWHMGARQTDKRKGLISRAEKLPKNHLCRLVVLQPQLTKTEFTSCMNGKATPARILKMKQLNTLMLAARLSASSVGATFDGWAAQ